MLEQPEILEDDADAAPQRGDARSAATVAASLLKMRTLPRVGRSDRKSRRSSEVFPAPDGPVTNWNEPGPI